MLKPVSISCLPWVYDLIKLTISTSVLQEQLAFRNSFPFLSYCLICIIPFSFSKRKTSEEMIQEDKPRQKRMTPTSDGSNDSPTTSRDGESTDAERGNLEESDGADDSTDEEYVEKQEDDGNKDGDEDEGKVHSLKQNTPLVCRSKGNRFSKRLAGVPGHTIPESMKLGLKSRLRQRPSINTAAVDHIVVSDSEDDSSSEEATKDS